MDLFQRGGDQILSVFSVFSRSDSGESVSRRLCVLDFILDDK